MFLSNLKLWLFRASRQRVTAETDIPTSELDDDYVGIAGDEGVTRTVRRLRQYFLSPRKIKEPEVSYVHELTTYPYADAIGRVLEVPHKDCYISPTHGKLRELVVQTSDKVFKESNETTWARTDCPNVSYWSLRLVSNLRYQKGESLIWYAIKWVVKCHCLSYVLMFPTNKDPLRWNGNYPPFTYTFHGYPKAARNCLEEQPQEGRALSIVKATNARGGMEYSDINGETFDIHAKLLPASIHSSQLNRRLRPTRLNILTETEHGWTSDKEDMEQWRKKNETNTDPQYVFIAYTRDQFQSDNDFNQLHKLATIAALDAGFRAFWLDTDCVNPGDQTDLYRVADYVRQSASVVIIRGPQPCRDQLEHVKYKADELREMLRELLLAPNSIISVYTKGMDDPERIPKTQIADIAWEDAARSGDLVNHFQNNIQLSRLELISIALVCFHNRKLSRETGDPNHKGGPKFKGDRAYALAGLLRSRPLADESDSEFQAFARLSLINESDRILERFLCLYPTSLNASWQSMEDAWNVPLWDVYPTCQISAIADNDTVIIDGARGAAVRWKNFVPVTTFTRPSIRRKIAYLALHVSGYMFWIGVILMILRWVSGRFNSTSLRLLVLCLAIVHFLGGTPLLLSTPFFVKRLASGKSYGHQAWLFGMEGHEKIEEIERRIWANSTGRLKWSPYGSPLSTHQAVKLAGKSKECKEQTQVRGIDPMLVPRVRNYIEEQQSKHGMKLFTLVDTVSMTVFLFLAKRPPTAFLICGQEGGMQRAVGVSYDHTSETVHRETVLRFETTTLQRMAPVPRCRIGFGRDSTKGQWETTNVRTNEERRGKWSLSMLKSDGKAGSASARVREIAEEESP
ncbi:MAG: hypothetical protein Q9165_007665 [Trypethelium subeluteriae]